MTKSATRRAVPAGWLEHVFSQDAQAKLLHRKPARVDFGAGLFIAFRKKNKNEIAKTKPPDKPPWISRR